MKSGIIFTLAYMFAGVIGKFIGITKEEAVKSTTVRLVRKDWSLEGYNPGTDEPLRGFNGTFSQLHRLVHTKIFSKTFAYVSEPLATAARLFKNPNYNSSLPLVIVTHPMTVGDSMFITFVIAALSTRNLQKHYNIFAMHAPTLGLQFQTSCARIALGLDPMLKPVAEAFASFLLEGLEQGKLTPGQINFIGFSYSGTLNAYIAREIRDNTGMLAHTLMTLDAFQYNHRNPHFTPISKDDAVYVHMIHTTSKFAGTSERIGTVDIVVNDGVYQPGCPKEINKGGGCSHRRVVAIFMFSVMLPGSIVARQCDSWEEFNQCKCSDPDNPLLVVSFPVNEEARGTYYVRTRGVLPFALTTKGAYCKEEENLPHYYKK